jgi:HK97 family phage portal protein
VSLFGRALERRAISYQSVWGRGGDVAPVNEQRALRLAAVFGAVRLIGDGLSSLPLQEYSQRSDGTLVQTPTSLMLTSPTEFGTAFDWKFQACASLALRGNLYGLPTGRDRSGRVTRVEWIHPDDVQLNGEDDVLWWRSRPRLEWLVEGRPTDELVHVRGFVLPGRVLGLSPIGAFQTLISTGIQAQQFGHDWFQNGSIPAAVLETDQALRQSDALAVKERFKLAAQGREPVALGRGVKYKPISVAANESQFLETIAATATTIAAIFGVPAEEIGGETGGTLTYNTDETRARRIQRVTLRPYMARIEEAVSALLPPDRVVQFNADAHLRAETLARYQAHEIALRNGWLNRDEVRAIEDRPPLPNGEGQEYVTAPPPTTGFGGAPDSGGATP